MDTRNGRSTSVALYVKSVGTTTICHNLGMVMMPTTIEMRMIRVLLDELRSLVRELTHNSRYSNSLLDQLRALVTTKGSKLNGGSSGKSRSLINISAYDLLQKAYRDWGHPPEVMLRETVSIADMCSELAHVATIVDEVRDLASAIRDTVDPPRRMHLRNGKGRAAACPRCGERTYRRTDMSGQEVLAPVLEIDEWECVCRACGKQWLSTQFEWLARMISDE